MEVGVQRTDSQRLQANGPRVSFNRDVHVKRIGKRPNETADYPIQTTNLQPPQTYQLRRELPADLSEESILKEAALVLAQAESVRCTAAGGSEIVGGRLNEKSRGKIQRPVPNKFHSLPSRKKNPKPITRSVSDASSKKPKKPSIFNIFSRKSDPNLDQIEPDRRFKEGGGRRLIRSKSDASPTRDRKYLRKKLSDNEESLSPSKPVQLSPIIENTQKEDYFEKITAKSKNEEKPKEEKPRKESSDEPKLKDSSPTKKSETKLPPGNIGYTSHEDLDLIPAKPVGDGLKDTLTSLALHSQSLEDMHSSQLPQEKPPLTKGVTVDGMVKRLSMERFSPPPHISGPAFSYTRPNEQIIYAQVVCDSDGRPRHEDLQPKEMDSSYRYQTNGYDHRSAIERNNYTTSQKKSEVYIGDNYGTQYRSYSPPQVTRIRGTQSPTYLKQSPRNLSDEDEGLGFEPRKYFEDDLPSSTPSKLRGNTLKTTDYERSKSPSYDPPIIPVIRSLSPIEVKVDADRGRADGMDSRRKEPFSEFNNLSYRREALESKIKSRRIGSVDRRTGSPVNLTYRYSPERSREYKKEFEDEQTNRYLSPDRDQKFHKLDSREIINKYSPERTHLDMVSPNKDLKTSKFTHTKYYDDGTGGVKEIYQKETRVDEHGQPHTRESRRRERLDSPRRSKERENGYSNGHAEKYRVEYEPKSLDSQFSEVNRSSPENVKRTEVTRQRHEEQWQDSLKRDKRQQRSFDKGDSGIENDFRKESFNGEFTSKWRKRTYLDDIKSCELFIKKERRHTEELHPQRKKYDFVYRERSIDDGSHFDPRLDKYPKGTLKKKDDPVSYSSPGKEAGGTLKREKKIGSLEKVKKLFSSGRKKENKEVNGKKEPGKDHYMVKEEEMRSRYHEYRGVMADLREPNVPDIATRRRLSTPKASPLLKRTSSEKTTKPSPLSLRNGEETTKAEKSGWFKSLDRRSKKKANEKLGSSFRTSATTTEDEISTIRSKEKYRTPIAPPLPEKNLRFFGDTDIDSNPSMSKAASNQRIRPSVATLSKNQKYSQSAYHLDKISKQQHGSKSTPRSNSMQNLEEGFDEVDRPRRRQHSRSRNLDDISESASDTEVARETRQSSATKTPARESNVEYSKHRYEEHAVRRSHERDSRTPHRESSDTTRIEFRKPPPGPPKPARSVERTPNYATLNVRDRERLHDSSGTEGESSLHSQRSVVYLHATTIGAIPQPYHLSPRRRAMSREELRSKHKNQQQQQQQPMTRTVSRSVSMLAPWKPKHLHDGYEINYSQDATDKSRKISTMPRKQQSSSSSSKNKKNDATLRPRKYASSKDDLSSTRNSSLTSASKSGLSSNHRTLEKKSSSKETLSRRRAK